MSNGVRESIASKFSLESWQTGKVRESSRNAACSDPAIKDSLAEEWKDYTLMVEDKELFPNIGQLAQVSPVFRRLFSELHAQEKAASQKGKNRGAPAPAAIPSKPVRPGARAPANPGTDSKETKAKGQLILHKHSYQEIYDFILALQPRSLMPQSTRDWEVVTTDNVISLLALSHEFEVEFIWDECLIFLHLDIRRENILRHYSKLRQKRIQELEEILYEKCLDMLQQADMKDVLNDEDFQSLDNDAKVHLKLALQRGRKCLQCGSEKFPWRIQIACPKCKDVKLFEHRMCDTLSQEFAKLNQCKRCRNSITDVQWIWGGQM